MRVLHQYKEHKPTGITCHSVQRWDVVTPPAVLFARRRVVIDAVIVANVVAQRRHGDRVSAIRSG